ncbi:hypothetical protein NC653_003209, partial [Populus alba x Populus x berolinensis]
MLHLWSGVIEPLFLDTFYMTIYGGISFCCSLLHYARNNYFSAGNA